MKYFQLLLIFFSLFTALNGFYFEFNFTEITRPPCLDRLRFVYYISDDYPKGFATIYDNDENQNMMGICQNLGFYQSNFTNVENTKLEEMKTNKSLIGLITKDKAIFYHNSGNGTIFGGYGFNITFSDFVPIDNSKRLRNPCWIPPPPPTTTSKPTTKRRTTTPKAPPSKQTIVSSNNNNKTKCDIPIWVAIVVGIFGILTILSFSAAIWFWSLSHKLRTQLQSIKDVKKSQPVIPSTAAPATAATATAPQNSNKSKIFSETKNPLESGTQPSSATANEPIVSTKMDVAGIVPPGTEEEAFPTSTNNATTPASTAAAPASVAKNKSEINPFSGANDVKSQISKNKSVFH